MSDFLARMIDRAAGRLTTVRGAVSPHVLPAPFGERAAGDDALVTSLAGETLPVETRAQPPARATPAASPEIPRHATAASPEIPQKATSPEIPRQATAAQTADAVGSARAPSAADPLRSPAGASPVVAVSPHLAAEPGQHARASQLQGPPTMTPLAIDHLEAATPALPAVRVPEARARTPVNAAPTEPLVARPPAAPEVAGETIATLPETPTTSRASRAVVPMRKLDLREALAAAGRAIAQPPRPAPRQERAEEIEISIGHIEVRAPAPSPLPAAAPARRGPSISLADYLARRPGSPR